MAPKAEEMVKY